MSTGPEVAPSEWYGLGASEGTANGPARWIDSQDDLEAFLAGEVLVARMTSPDWGAVYQRAAAVVTMEGGMLCHAALVAREENIPAVVGIGDALRSVRTGQILYVDGTEGAIRATEMP